MKQLLIFLLVVKSLFAISLDRLVALTMKNNLELKSFDIRKTKKELEAQKNSIWADPILGVGVNDISFSKPFKRDLEPMQTQYITLSRVIPTANKLEIKSHISSIDAKIQEIEKEELKRVLLSKVIGLSYRYILVKKKIALIKSSIDIFKKEQKLLNYLYESSTLSLEPILGIKNRIDLKWLKVQELLYIKEQIAKEIEKLSFVTIKDIEAKSFIKKFKIDTYKAINSHPTIRALEQKIESIKSQIELEKAKKVADIKVGIGYFNRDGFDDYASINFSMPLKITDRESINIKQKRLELNILNLKLKNSKHIMKKDIANLKKWLNKSIKNIKILDKRVLKTNSQLKTLIKEYAKTTDSNSLKLYKNQNRKIELELLKIDEMILYYQAYSKLLYYGGRR